MTEKELPKKTHDSVAYMVRCFMKHEIKTDHERLAFIEAVLSEVCRHCGAIVIGPKCQCWNDE